MAYLDHAATTPMLPAAMAAMTKELGEVGNASSLHAAGRRARRVVEESREAIAAAFGARPSEVVFTAGGTEADNLAVKGMYWVASRSDVGRESSPAPSSITRSLTRCSGWSTTRAPRWSGSSRRGRRVDLEQIHEEIARDPESVALVTVMWANNEVGTVQPIDECAALAAGSACRSTPTQCRRPACSRSTSPRPAWMR